MSGFGSLKHFVSFGSSPQIVSSKTKFSPIIKKSITNTLNKKHLSSALLCKYGKEFKAENANLFEEGGKSNMLLNYMNSNLQNAILFDSRKSILIGKRYKSDEVRAFEKKQVSTSSSSAVRLNDTTCINNSETSITNERNLNIINKEDVSRGDDEWIGMMPRDPIQDYLNKYENPLASFFEPKSVAVVGATEREGSVGRTVLYNMLEGNKHRKENEKMKIYPINRKRETCLGVKCYKTLRDISEGVDLVVVVTPANTVSSVIRDAAHVHAKSAIVITAGFKEAGEEGVKLEEEIVQIGRENNIRIIGPNCLGLMNTHHNLNATFASGMAIQGDIGLISQSGAVCTAVLDWANEKNIGFSSFISIGSMADVEWGDLIYYLGNDVNTKSILIYMESVGNVSGLLRAAQEVALIKPIIIIKCGKSADAARAAASHTGSMVGSYDVFEAAMKRVGVLIVDTIGELFNCALVLGKQPRPKGSKVLMITNAGGPAVLATDSVCTSKCQMAKLSDNVVQKLNEFLPNAWSKANPVDILGDASAERYAKTLEVLLEEEDEAAYDCVLVILSPQDVTEPTATANKMIEVLKKYNENAEKKNRKKVPIIASWMGGMTTKEGLNILNEYGVPTFEFPDEAAKTFACIYKQNKFLQMMYEIPNFEVESNERNESKEKSKPLIDFALQNNHTFLTECCAKQLLKAYGIRVAEMLECRSVEEAEENAEKLGYPIVAKLNSYTITHKSNVKGVMLNLQNKKEVGEAFKTIHENLLKYGGSEEDFQGIAIQKMVDAEGGIELILGTSCDPSFGPMILFGTGGIFVEVYKDRALGLPPLNATLARRLMEETKIYGALQEGHGKRFPVVDTDQLAAIVVKFSQMVGDMYEYIDECEINPLLVNSSGLVALDARISLKKKDEIQKVPKPPIRPYPAQYSFVHQMPDGSEVRIRPMCASDEPALKEFHHNLSPESVRHRYIENFDLKERIQRQNLIGVCCADYDKMIALCAEDKKTKKMVGVCRVQKFFNAKDVAEIKVVVVDREPSSRKLIELLLKNAIYVGKEEKLRMLHTLVLSDNTYMVDLLKAHSFELKEHPENQELYEAYLHLPSENLQ